MPNQARYTRNHQAISEEEQQRLAGKRVLVAGCGGLGGYLIELLGRIGVGQITAIDGDVFEESNLNRQLLSTEDTLGLPKAQAAAARLAAVNPLVTVKPLQTRLEAHNARELLTGHDLVMDALDNIPSRLVLEQGAEELGIPLVHGAIAGWCGHVATVLPGDRLLHFLYEGVSTDGKGDEVHTGNLGFTASATASLQVAEAIKVLLGRGELLRRQLLEIDLLRQSYEIIHLS